MTTGQFSFSLGYQLEAGFTNRLDWLGFTFSADYVYHTFRWDEASNIAQSMLKGNVSLGVYPIKKEDFFGASNRRIEQLQCI